jgi:hypothetical protein
MDNLGKVSRTNTRPMSHPADANAVKIIEVPQKLQDGS